MPRGRQQSNEPLNKVLLYLKKYHRITWFARDVFGSDRFQGFHEIERKSRGVTSRKSYIASKSIIMLGLWLAGLSIVMAILLATLIVQWSHMVSWSSFFMQPLVLGIMLGTAILVAMVSLYIMALPKRIGGLPQYALHKTWFNVGLAMTTVLGFCLSYGLVGGALHTFSLTALWQQSTVFLAVTGGFVLTSLALMLINTFGLRAQPAAAPLKRWVVALITLAMMVLTQVTLATWVMQWTSSPSLIGALMHPLFWAPALGVLVSAIAVIGIYCKRYAPPEDDSLTAKLQRRADHLQKGDPDHILRGDFNKRQSNIEEYKHILAYHAWSTLTACRRLRDWHTSQTKDDIAIWFGTDDQKQQQAMIQKDFQRAKQAIAYLRRKAQIWQSQKGSIWLRSPYPIMSIIVVMGLMSVCQILDVFPWSATLSAHTSFLIAMLCTAAISGVVWFGCVSLFDPLFSLFKHSARDFVRRAGFHKINMNTKLPQPSVLTEQKSYSLTTDQKIQSYNHNQQKRERRSKSKRTRARSSVLAHQPPENARKACLQLISAMQQGDHETVTPMLVKDGVGGLSWTAFALKHFVVFFQYAIGYCAHKGLQDQSLDMLRKLHNRDESRFYQLLDATTLTIVKIGEGAAGKDVRRIQTKNIRSNIKLKSYVRQYLNKQLKDQLCQWGAQHIVVPLVQISDTEKNFMKNFTDYCDVLKRTKPIHKALLSGWQKLQKKDKGCLQRQRTTLFQCALQIWHQLQTKGKLGFDSVKREDRITNMQATCRKILAALTYDQHLWRQQFDWITQTVPTNALCVDDMDLTRAKPLKTLMAQSEVKSTQVYASLAQALRTHVPSRWDQSSSDAKRNEVTSSLSADTKNEFHDDLSSRAFSELGDGESNTSVAKELTLTDFA